VNHFFHTIKFKIILAFCVCITLMATMGLFGIVGLSRLNSNIDSAYFGNTVAIGELSDVRAAQLDIRAKLRRLQATRTQEDVARTLPGIKANLATIDKVWNSYYPAGITSGEERAIANGIDSSLSIFRSQTNDAIATLSSGNFDAAADFINKSADSSDSLTKSLTEDAAQNMLQAKQSADDSNSTYLTLLWLAIVLVSVGVITVVGVSAYLIRAISGPLSRAVGVANHIAGGKLENDIETTSRDEFGQLLEALKKMDSQLTDTVRGIKASTESVTIASREIASGNTDLSARTEEQAASLEETAASMAQLTETVKQNADNARQANGLATRATDIADAGNEAVQGMVGTIEKISGSSSKISEITGVIEGIAFQTNILALNAAVEAARAGEQGRGFAVVASEVRSLAQRSAAAAKEIKELISSSVTMIQDGAKQATDVNATMGQVKQAIKQVSDIVGEIAAASEEQSRGIEQVNQAVNQMDEVTQQNAALVEQAAAAAQSLEEQAVNLKNAVSVFKLADTGLSASRAVIPRHHQPRLPTSRIYPTRRVAPAKPRVAPAPIDETNTAAANTAGADWQTF
jgi:methyl-accepting chemotaxis protein